MTKWQPGGWTPEKALDELKERSGGGRSIRFAPGKKDQQFKDAIYHNFGGWPAALRAAGLHPKTRLINYWTEDEVVRRIRTLAESGESINTLNLETNHPRLWNAARRLYGNIRKSVEAAGFDYNGIKKRGTWTEQTITQKIQDYYNQGKDISQISMLELDSRLLAAGQKFYNSWSRAVTAAGIDYNHVKAKRREAKRRIKSVEQGMKKRKVFIIRQGKLIQTNNH